MIEHGALWPLLARMSECLCTELSAAREAGDPEVCFCGVVPGEGPLVDYAGNGMMAWVRLDTSYPTTSFPEPDTSARCSTMWAHDIEVGIAECIPTFMDSQGGLPTAEEQTEFVRRQTAQVRVLRRAILCCLEKSGVRDDYRLGSYTPTGPSGSIYGGHIMVTVLEA